jgi:hypothetical protein
MEGQPNIEGLIPITMTVAFPDFLFSHRQASRATVEVTKVWFFTCKANIPKEKFR